MHHRMTTETSKGQLYKRNLSVPEQESHEEDESRNQKKNVNGRSLLVSCKRKFVKNLNPKITGWKNYSTKTNEKWIKALDWYIICYLYKMV